MNSRFRRQRWTGLVLLLLLVTGCAFNHGLQKPEGDTDFLQEIARLEKLSREHPVKSVRAQYHLQLAFLYVEAKNPRLNYARALEEIKVYLSLAPDGIDAVDVQNWLSALKEMDHLRTDNIELRERNRILQTSTEKMQVGLEKVQEVNRNLREEVGSLKETIGKLNYLDRQLEEKRRLMK